MDDNSLLREAKRELGTADHILMVTFPLVKEKKIFINVLRHTNKSVFLAIKAFILNKRKTRELRIVPESEDLTRRMFIGEFSGKVGITPSEVHLLKELNNIVNSLSKNQNEFEKGEQYMVFLPNFDSITLNEQNVKKYLSMAREVISKIDKVISDGKW